MNTVVEALRALLTEAKISTDREDLEAHAKDAWPLAAKWTPEELDKHLPLCVIRPESLDAVTEIVRAVQERDCTIVPYGGGSGVTGAAVPSNDTVVLDLREQTEILDFDPQNGMVRVQAGLLAGTLETWLGERGYTLGHYPQSLYLASMGGLVATRSTGTFSSKYGGIEDLLVALDVVLPTGELAEFRQLPRTATGPKLIDLFVGAEGTLGVITTVTVKIFPIPEQRTFLGYTFPSLESGLNAVQESFGRHIVPAVLRLYDSIEAQGLYGLAGIDSEKPLLIVGHEGTPIMADAERDVFAEIAERWDGEPLGATIGDAWERHRFNADWLEEGNDSPTRMADAIEVAAKWTDLLPLYEDVTEVLTPLTAKVMSHFSHFYSTGGSIYFIFFVEGNDEARTKEAYARVWQAALRHTLDAGGTISHHHGVGLVRNDLMREELGSTFVLLERIKRALDPKNKLSPGKLGLSQESRGA